MSFIEHLQNSQWVWAVLTIGTIVGIPSFFLAIKSFTKRTIKYNTESNVLISNQTSIYTKLKILYDDNETVNLTVTNVTFWNSTHLTINDFDIVKADPFSILVDGTDILDVSILYGHNTPNQVRINKIENNKVYIDFDYLDKKDGSVVQIIHTHKAKNIQLLGRIKGGKIISHSSNLYIYAIESILGGFIGVLIAIFLFYLLKSFSLGEDGIIALICGVSMSIFSLPIARNLIRKKSIPKFLKRQFARIDGD